MATHQLTHLASGALEMASHYLIKHYEFDPKVVGDPGIGDLVEMLTELGRPYGQFILYALLLGRAPASVLAVEHEAELKKAITEAHATSVPACRWSAADPELARENDHGVERAGSVDPEDPGILNPDEVDVQLGEMRRFATEVASALRTVAEDVESGLPPSVEIDALLIEYSRRRGSLVESVAHLTQVSSSTGFDGLAEGIDEHRIARASALREQEVANEKIRDVERQIAELEAMVESAPEAVRSSLTVALEAMKGQRAELGPVVADVASPDQASVPVPLPELEHSEADESLAESIETDVDVVEPDEVVVEEHRITSEAPVSVIAEDLPSGATEPDSPHVAARTFVEDDLAHGFPWEEGDPPLAVRLTCEGRIAEAYWVTAMSGEPDRRAAVLRFAAAAYTVHNNSDATAILAALDLDAQMLTGDMDAAVVATTAILRAGLIAGWGHSLLAQLQPELTLPTEWAALVDASITAVRRSFRVDYGVGVLPPEDDVSEAKVELGRRAKNLAEELPRRKNSYQRATRVLQRLMLTDQPLSSALHAVIAWSEGTGDGVAVGAALDVLSAPDAAQTMIELADAAMRKPKQAREPIVATALRALLRAIDEVHAIVREADVVSRRLTIAEADDRAVSAGLSRALADVESVDPPHGMTGAAMALFRGWLRDPSAFAEAGEAESGAAAGTLTGIVEPNVDVLLALPHLPRDAAGRPDPEDPRTSAVLADLIEPVDLGEVVSAYSGRGDLRRARRVIELAEAGAWPETRGSMNPVDLVDVEAARWAKRYRASFGKARDLFARIRTQNLLDPDEETVTAGRIEALTTVTDEAYDEATKKLAELVDDLKVKQGRRIDELRRELATLATEDRDKARVVALLEDGDTVTAAEFLAFVRAGKSLPEHTEPKAQDVKVFSDVVSRGVAAGAAGPMSNARAWAELVADGDELTELASAGVDAWRTLTDSRLRTSGQLATPLRDILRMLGILSSNRPSEFNPGDRKGFRKFRVHGSTSDQSYVSALGSAATDYTVTVLTEEQRGRSVLDVLGPEDTGRANIVLYLHTMDLNVRRAVAGQAINSQVQALVVDPAVIGWVAATAPGSWRATQRVTLPWTALNPYTPFVAGLVPPEVFVGRDKEMAEVVDPNGGLFIYGGRQLGKSALLRRVEATYNVDEFRHAVYIDLKGRGIGEAEPASRIWRELVVELKDRSVLTSKVSKDAPAEVVVKQVKEWLNHNPSRRLLLLADEADAFLTADSRGVNSLGGAAHFPNVLRLKELMESTERRFKVVFAGLHQVQRFGHLSNVPLAHGGPDILVGPLDAAAARRLVVAPLAALGYRFERPELVWRVLSATNFQASLIQIFCHELVLTLHSRVSQMKALPVPIRESDVEAVAASDRVRARIAERLRITINLEDRYRVLTLVIALLSLNDSFGADYGPDELLGLARQRWPAGFDDLTASQVSICLDEMVGLGLLIRLSGQSRYAVRSPNVVNMLGTKSDLERELAETDFDLPYEYNPRDARRLLVNADGLDRRSPLTDGQLSALTAPDAVSVVSGTVALGVDRVPDAIKDYAEMRGSRVEVYAVEAELAKAVTSAARRIKPTVLVADLRGKTLVDAKRVGLRLARERPASVLLVDPEIAVLVAESLGVETVRPSRWTAGSLRSWPECPFDVLLARTRLMDATGGWPELVEFAIGMVLTRGTPQAQALERVLEPQRDQDWASNLLRTAGLDKVLQDRIAGWADYFDPGDQVSPADVAAALELDIAYTNDLLVRLAELGVLDESGEGVALDTVVHRCLATLRVGR